MRALRRGGAASARRAELRIGPVPCHPPAMTQHTDDTDLMPLVAVGASLVAIGTALGATWPVLGDLILVAAVTLLAFAVVRMTPRVYSS